MQEKRNLSRVLRRSVPFHQSAFNTRVRTEEILIAIAELEPVLPVAEHVLEQEERIEMLRFLDQNLACFDGEFVATLNAEQGPDRLRARGTSARPSEVTSRKPCNSRSPADPSSSLARTPRPSP